MDRGAWWATVHRVAKKWDTAERLSMPSVECNVALNVEVSTLHGEVLHFVFFYVGLLAEP